MKKDFKNTIDQLLNHNLTKEETVNKLLFLCSVSSSVKVGDRVRIDGYNESNVEVLSIENDKALCKLTNGLEYKYELYRMVRL